MTEAAFFPKMDEGGADDQAREWLTYLYSGSATEDGRKQFSLWLQCSAENAQAYADAEQVWRDFVIPGAEDRFPAMAENYIEGSQVSEKEPKPFWSWLSWSSWFKPMPVMAVACVVFLALIGWIAFIAEKKVMEATYETRIAEVKAVDLPDGSALMLGGGSSIRVSFSDGERQVELMKGNAYFDIASEAERQFTVVAGQTAVHVLGTAFDVQRRDQGVRVAVTSGLVEVASVAVPQDSQHILRARLKAGEQVLTTDNGMPGETSPFKAETALAWREGRLVYVNEPLRTVLAEVNRYRQKKITLADESLGDIRVTTALRFDETDKILLGLERTRPVWIEMAKKAIVIHPKG